MLNVYKEGDKMGKKVMKWKSGCEHPKSVVITDFGTATSIPSRKKKDTIGTAGWAPPEQWLGEFMIWLVSYINREGCHTSNHIENCLWSI